MTPLRQRMLDAMLQRGFSPRTQESYVDAIYGMARHYRRDPAQYTAQEVERALLRTLPARRTGEFEEVPARVSKYAIFTVRGAQYSAPSRLIGQRLTVRLYTEHIECWLGGTRVLERARLRHRDGQRHPRDIDYRHLIGALRRKPGAFARWVLRDAMFPRAVYRQTWERLSARLTEREACKTIVGLLVLAAEGHEAQLATELAHSGSQRARQHHYAILVALAFPNNDDVAGKIHILDPKANAFHQAHTGTVQQARQQSRFTFHLGQHAGNLVQGQHAGNAALVGGAVDVVHPG